MKPQEEDFDCELECTYCGGDGYFYGDELPGFDWATDDPEGINDCPACFGTGLRKKQTIF